MFLPAPKAEVRPDLGFGCFCLLMLAASGCEPAQPPAPPPVRWGGETMGTTYSVAVAELPAGVSLKDARAAVEDELAAVNRQMSTWDPGSELSRFNASDSIDWLPVSRHTAAVVALALDIAEESGGAFDPTVGPLVDLWGFGGTPRPTGVPTDDELAAVRAVVGYEKLHARRDPPALRKDVPGLRVNVSAVAKGHGADRVFDRLTGLGVEDLLVEIGGEIRAGGAKAGGVPWAAGIEAPIDDVTGTRRRVRRAVPLALEPVAAAMATSGNYRNFYELDGERVVHTLDPRTGRPAAAGALAAVSVLAADCATADALATAVMVLGADDGRRLLERRGAAALLLVRSNGEVVEEPTAEWRRLYGR